MDENGATFVDDVGKGDVWFFPPYVIRAPKYRLKGKLMIFLEAFLTAFRRWRTVWSFFWCSTRVISQRTTPSLPRKYLRTILSVH
jgi:hypothetical protein